MKISLTRIDPPSILSIHNAEKINVNIPAKWQMQDVGAGWISPDKAFQIVQVVEFVPPEGKSATGEPHYEISNDGVVTENYSIVDTPVPAAKEIVLSPLDFIGMLTNEEALAITKAGQTDEQISLFMTMASAADAIHMTDPRTLGGLQYLMSKGLLTEERIQQIVQGQKPVAQGGE